MGYEGEESKLFPCLDKIIRETNTTLLISFTMVTVQKKKQKFQVRETTLRFKILVFWFVDTM
jgi:hypothetical protein